MQRATTIALAACLAAAASGCDRGATAGEVQRAPDQQAATPPPAAPGGRGKPVAPARLRFEVRDVTHGQPIPAKITLLGAAGSPDPDVAYGDTPRAIEGGVAAHNYVMTLSGRGALDVPQGTYDIFVSRGPEWDLWAARGVAIGPEGASIQATLAQVVDTRGWLSADLHVHAAPSHDSRVPLDARVHQFAADGVDLLVSADHGEITDYGPVVAGLGAGAVLATAAGQEITADGWGHFGAFPLPVQRGAHAAGAIASRERTPVQMFRDARARAPGALITVFHPRFNWGMGYFPLGELDPAQDRAGRAGFSFDFDAVEVLNGLEAANHESVEAVLADWFALLRHGHLVAATGSSDTHHLDGNIGGYPRNYVRVQRDTPATARPAEVARALKGMRSFFTTAPFVQLRVGGAGPGELATAQAGRARGEIAVLAAPWVSVSTVVLYVDGVEARRWRAPESRDVERFHASFEIPLERDSFVVARVEGDEPLAPVVGGTKHHRVRPFALTNPVLLDANGDRRFSPAEPHGGH